MNRKYGYKETCWISNQFKNVWVASPIYDWSTSDVWHANYTFQYDYNRLYDLYYMAGLKPDQMRVASPFNDYAKDSLNLYRVIDPQIWVKLIGRVRGANFGAIYGRTKAMGYKNITLPAGHTWESYTRFYWQHCRQGSGRAISKNSKPRLNSGIRWAADWKKKLSASWRNTAIISGATAFPITPS